MTTQADQDLLIRVQKQLQDNEVALRIARDELRRRRPEMERSLKVARQALSQLRAAGVAR
jgi:hypothetical protein